MEKDKTRCCSVCGTEGSHYRCECGNRDYCGPECQNSEWKEHRQECTWYLGKKLAERRKKLGKDDALIGESHFDIAAIHYEHGQYEEAERNLIEAKRIYASVHNPEHPKVADACSNLGSVYQEMGRYGDSLKMYGQALEIFRTDGDREEVASTLHNMGNVCWFQALLEEAVEHYVAALDILYVIVGKEHARVARSLGNVGVIYRELGRYDESLKALESALKIHRVERGNDSEPVASSLLNIGTVFFEQGRYEEARVKYEESRGIYRRVHGQKHPSVAWMLYNIAETYNKQNQLDQAISLHEKALKIRQQTLGEDNFEVGESVKVIAKILYYQGKDAESLARFEEAAGIYERSLGADNVEVARMQLSQALCKVLLGREESAIADAKAAYRIFLLFGDDAAQEAQVALECIQGLEKGIDKLMSEFRAESKRKAAGSSK